MSNLEILKDLDTAINTKDWRENTLRKINIYRKQVPNLRFLKKISKLLNDYKLSKAKRTIKWEIFLDRLKKLFAETKNRITEYMIKSALEDGFILVEPTYKITKEEYDELMAKIENMCKDDN